MHVNNVLSMTLNGEETMIASVCTSEHDQEYIDEYFLDLQTGYRYECHKNGTGHPTFTVTTVEIPDEV